MPNTTAKKAWESPAVRAFRISGATISARSHATRLSAGGLADDWATQMHRQTNVKAFKKSPR